MGLMSALDAAANVLSAAGKPMRVDDLTAQLLADGLWSSSGKTPTATVHAQLASDLKKTGARQESARSDRTPVALMAGNELVALLVEHQSGVRRAAHDLLELQVAPELPADDDVP